MSARTLLSAAASAAAAGLLAGCAADGGRAAPAPDGAPSSPSSPSSPPAASPSPAASPTATSPSESRSPGPDSSASPERPGPRPGDGAPRRALLSIPELGIGDLAVVPYRGRTDDAAGTRIQDRGLAASPHGPRGGTGPGGIGNYQVTAHRLSSTQAFRYLPGLQRGDRVHVVAGGTRWTYAVRDTRRTSFRDPASLRAQRAAVPGRPGREPTRAMITLSTCRTIEDRAEGNDWSDEFGNPENRIDKIGVLVSRSPA